MADSFSLEMLIKEFQGPAPGFLRGLGVIPIRPLVVKKSMLGPWVDLMLIRLVV